MESGMYIGGAADEGEPTEVEAYHLPERVVRIWVDELGTLPPRLDPASFTALCAAMRTPGLLMDEE